MVWNKLFILSVFIDPETCPQVCYQIFSWPYPKRTYIFASPAGFWKVAVRVPVFVISPVVVNTLIGFESVPQVHCDWFQVNHFKVFLSIFGECIFKSVRDVDL